MEENTVYSLDQYVSSIDLTAIAATVTAFGIGVIGVKFGEKGVRVVKRWISMI